MAAGGMCLEQALDTLIRQIGETDDGARQAAPLTFGLQPARLAGRVRRIPSVLDVDRLDQVEAFEISPQILRQIIALQPGDVAGKGPCPSVVGQPGIVVCREILEVMMGVDELISLMIVATGACRRTGTGS